MSKLAALVGVWRRRSFYKALPNKAFEFRRYRLAAPRSSGHMKVRIEGRAGLQHAVDDVHELAHGGDDGDVAGLAGGAQALEEGANDGVVLAGGQRGHEQALAQQSRPHARNVGRSMHAFARLVLTGIEPEVGNEGADIVEAFDHAGEAGQHQRQRGRTDAGNGPQQLALVAQVRMRLNVLANLLFELLDLRLQRLDMRFDARSHHGLGDRETVALLLAHLLEALHAQEQGLERPHRWRQRLPGQRVHGSAEARDQAGIHAIGLGAQQLAGGKRLDARGVDDADAHAGIKQEVRECIAIDAGGLQTDVRIQPLVFGQPDAQLLKARGGIGKTLAAVTIVLAQERRVEGLLGDIDAEVRAHAGINLVSAGSPHDGGAEDTVRSLGQERVAGAESTKQAQGPQGVLDLTATRPTRDHRVGTIRGISQDRQDTRVCSLLRTMWRFRTRIHYRLRTLPGYERLPPYPGRLPSCLTTRILISSATVRYMTV